MLDRKEGYIV